MAPFRYGVALALALLLAGIGWPAVPGQLHGLASLSLISAALADDDDDDDRDDDDDDDDRPVQRPRAVAPPPPPPEFVVAVSSTGEIDAIAAAGFAVVARAPLGLTGGEVARVNPPPGVGLEAARAAVAAIVPGAVLDLNHIYRPNAFLCEGGACAAFDAIGWPAEAGACGEIPAIGMIDTAVNPDHAGLAGRDVEIVPAASPDRRPSSRIHGTAIANLLVGNPDSRTPGLLPDARLIAVEAFHRDGRGDAADAFDLVRAIDLLVARGVGVINMSLAGPDNLLLARIVTDAAGRDVALVAAAGNAGPRAAPLFPAAYPEVIAVTAIDRDNRVFRQAAAGAHIAFAAPGVQLWTAASVSGGRLRSGTSYATPFVTAAVALARAARPGEPVDEIVAALVGAAQDLGPPGRDDTFGHGLVRASFSCATE